MFSSGVSVGGDGLAAETDDYLRAKFAKAKAAPGKAVKKTKAKARPKPPPAPEPRSREEEELEAERELLGIPAAPKQEAAPQPIPARDAEQPQAQAGAKHASEDLHEPRWSGQACAVRLAAPGSLQGTSRSCPEGHSLVCYIVGWSAALCDECDFMQKPGQIVFGCRECECEMCVGCVLSTASSKQAAEEDLEVITKVARASKPGDSRFVATPSGAVLDTSPSALPAPCRTPQPATQPVALAPGGEAAPATQLVQPVADRAAGSGGEAAACPAGGCAMEWTSRAKYREYYCSGCHSGPRRDARWHCERHREDFCPECRAAPAEASAVGGADDIDTSSWKREGEPAPSRRGDMLSRMIAEQERMIQDCGLWLREAKEAVEGSRAAPRPARREPTSFGPGAPATAASEAGPPEAGPSPEEPAGPSGDDSAEVQPIDNNLMDENAARERPQWAVEGGARRKKLRSEPLQRTFDLTLTLVGDFVDELARGYSQPWYQELVLKCAQDCGYDRIEFLMRLQDVAFEVQKPVLENWGFDGDEQGVYDMTSILNEHSWGAPPWLQERVDHCLTQMYGGEVADQLV